MNDKLKEIAQETFKKLPIDNSKPEQWLDSFIIELSRRIIFECSDVVRASAKNYDNEVKLILKGASVDILDHFGI